MVQILFVFIFVFTRYYLIQKTELFNKKVKKSIFVPFWKVKNHIKIIKLFSNIILILIRAVLLLLLLVVVVVVVVLVLS